MPEDRSDLTVTIDIDAPVQRVWDAVVDWDNQGDWMLGTQVRGTVQSGVGVGGGLEAFTGVRGIGFLDTMEITAWDPPHRCDVRHTGRLVRGTGVFEVLALPGGQRSRFVWQESLEPAAGRRGPGRLAAGPPAGRARHPPLAASPRPPARGARRSDRRPGRRRVTDLVIGADGLARCAWGASTADYLPYHDSEWGQPLRGDDRMFERLTLEAFQSGLSWITILRKRPAFRRAFADFSIPAVAEFDESDVERLMGDVGHRAQRGKDPGHDPQRASLPRAPRGAVRAALVVRPSVKVPSPHIVCRGPCRHARVDGTGQGHQEAGVGVRGTHDRLRPDAGHRHGR